MGPPQRLEAGQTRKPGRVLHHLDTGEPGNRGVVLGHHADQLTNPAGCHGWVESKHLHAPSRQPHETENGLHERALAGPIRPHEPGDAGGNVERDTGEHDPPAISLLDLLESHRQTGPLLQQIGAGVGH